MNKAFKGGNALWVIITIISLLSAAGLLFFMLQERTKRIESEQQLSKTEKAKRAVEIELDHAQLELIQVKDKRQLLEKQLEQSKNDYQILLAETDKKDSQIAELGNDLANEKKQRASLANNLAQLGENYDSLEEKLKAAKLKVENFKSQLEKFTGKTGVRLKKIVVKPKKELSGKVLVVNTEFLFVVIDLGRKDGVSVGDEFVVYLASEEIGKVRVEKVYGTMSSAAILAGSQEHKISEDSIVKSWYGI